jgi:twinkle protein
VSSHYRVHRDDLIEYLQRKRLYHRDLGDKLNVKNCPLCHDTHGKADNQYKLFIWTDTGSYFCHRCGSKGSWYDFKRQLGDLADVASARQLASSSSSSSSPPSQSSSPSSSNRKKASSKSHALNQSEAHSYARNISKFPNAVKLLTGQDRAAKQRGLSIDTLNHYGVGAGVFSFRDDNNVYRQHVCITFPWTRNNNDDRKQIAPYYVDRVKIRSMEDKSKQRLLASGGPWGFFGWHTVPDDAKAIVITEGEYDAMAVYEATAMCAISLPNGAQSLPVELLPRLERFERIYLWMDDDMAGQQGAEKFAHKLGVGRCLLVRNSNSHAATQLQPKDANEYLLAAPSQPNPDIFLSSMKDHILQSSPLSHEQITTFNEVRQEIFREFSEPRAVRGLQARTLPAFNAILKGFRRGELTVITGGTGVGKTTLLAQLSLDYCQQGVTTLWGSFEITMARLAKKMLSQYSQVDLERNLQFFDMWADRFSSLPMYFMRFFGSTDVDSVLDAMDYAVYVHDVEHILLDNLQFMLSGQGRGSLDRFEIQDRAIEKFRQFATNKNVHITLVIHPRKETDGQPLGIQSVFGTAKATQEADNIVIIQNATPCRRIEVKKNRFDGDLGTVYVVFDKQRNRYVELSRKEMSALGIDTDSSASGSAEAHILEQLSKMRGEDPPSKPHDPVPAEASAPQVDSSSPETLASHVAVDEAQLLRNREEEEEEEMDEELPVASTPSNVPDASIDNDDDDDHDHDHVPAETPSSSQQQPQQMQQTQQRHTVMTGRRRGRKFLKAASPTPSNNAASSSSSPSPSPSPSPSSSAQAAERSKKLDDEIITM